MSESQTLRRPRMTRIRHIKPEFFKHELLFEAEEKSKLPCRIALAGLWCVADVEGRFEWAPRRIKLEVLPYDVVDFAKVLDALVAGDFVHKYEVEGKTYGHVRTFHKHQRVDRTKEPASLIPDHNVHCPLCNLRGTKGEPLAIPDLPVSASVSVSVSERVREEGEGTLHAPHGAINDEDENTEPESKPLKLGFRVADVTGGSDGNS